jgi:hypothetical protein
MRLALFALAFGLAACGADPITMVNPQNGATHLCSSPKLDPILARQDVQQCVGIMEAVGWRSR